MAFVGGGGGMCPNFTTNSAIRSGQLRVVNVVAHACHGHVPAFAMDQAVICVIWCHVLALGVYSPCLFVY